MTASVPNPGGGNAPVVYDAAASALFLRMTTQPNAARKQLISDTIARLKAVGFWSKLKALYVYAAHSQQAALLNWPSATLDASLVGAPTFTADKGFSGFTAANYLTTPMTLATFSPDTTTIPLVAMKASLTTAAAASSTVAGRALFELVNNATPAMSLIGAASGGGATVFNEGVGRSDPGNGLSMFFGYSNTFVCPGCLHGWGVTGGGNSTLTTCTAMRVGAQPAAVGLQAMSLVALVSTTITDTQLRRGMNALNNFIDQLGAIE